MNLFGHWHGLSKPGGLVSFESAPVRELGVVDFPAIQVKSTSVFWLAKQSVSWPSWLLPFPLFGFQSPLLSSLLYKREWPPFKVATEEMQNKTRRLPQTYPFPIVLWGLPWAFLLGSNHLSLTQQTCIKYPVTAGMVLILDVSAHEEADCCHCFSSNRLSSKPGGPLRSTELVGS